MNLIKLIKNIFKKNNKNNNQSINQISDNKPINQISDNKPINQVNDNKPMLNSNYNTQVTESITDQQLKNEYENNIQTVTVQELNQTLNTIWDILKIKENTQAEHLIKAIPSDKWTTMDEIKQNIKLEFNIEYKNEKSLYPYLKTLTDINLIKVNNTGKKRSWKKNIIIINK